MAQITVPQQSDSGWFFDRQHVEVQVRQTWGSTWQPSSYLVPVSAIDCSAPTIPRAEFRFAYGNIKREDTAVFAIESPLDLVDWFVRILIHTDGKDSVTLWHGVLTDDSDGMLGVAADGNPSGDQAMIAYGLEHLLDLDSISGAMVRTAGGSELEIGRLLPFNQRRAHAAGEIGNRTETVGGDGVYVFGDDGEVWDHSQVAEYLLEYHSPSAFTLSLSGQAASLTALRSVLDLDGKTLYQALNTVINRRQGFGWYLSVDDANGVSVEVFTGFETSVDTANGVIPANTKQCDLAFDRAIDLSRAVATRNRSQRYDRVRAVGEYVKACATFSFTDGNLEAGWDASAQTDYEYVSGSDAEEKDRERRTDKYARVFRAFRVPRSWNGVGGNWTGSGFNAIPSMCWTGALDIDTQAPFWVYGKQFLSWLPVFEETDVDDAEKELMRPLAFLKNTAGDVYQADAIADETDNLTPYAVRPMSGEFGMEVRSARINHTLAQNTFDPDTTASKIASEFDYNRLAITAAFETDERLAVTATLPGIAEDEGRTMTVHVPGAECWYVAPGTIIEATNKQAVPFDLDRSPTDDYEVRNDRRVLEARAKLLLAWYGRERSILDITVSDRLGLFVPVGSYVRYATHGTKTTPVGTVLTSRSWDFTAFSTTLKTGYGEFDALGIDYEPGESSPVELLRATKRIATAAQSERDRTAHLDARAPVLPFDRVGVMYESRRFQVDPSSGSYQEFATDWCDLETPVTVVNDGRTHFNLKWSGVDPTGEYVYLTNYSGNNSSAVILAYLDTANEDDEIVSENVIACARGELYNGATLCCYLNWFSAILFNAALVPFGESVDIAKVRFRYWTMSQTPVETGIKRSPGVWYVPLRIWKYLPVS